MEGSVRAAGGEFVLIYYASLSGTIKPLTAVSDLMDDYGFTESWRINDDDKILWNANDGGTWLFGYLPNAWIVNTQTMELIASMEHSGSFDILSIINSI